MVATDKPAYKVVGTRPIRPDGVDKVTGRAAYGGDFSATGLLYGSVLRSPHAHARITSIDTSRAAALEGVRAVITNADFPQPGESLVDLGEGATTSARWLLDNVLAADKALYTGHAVAAVAATDAHIAEDALELIDVEYEESSSSGPQRTGCHARDHARSASTPCTPSRSSASCPAT